MRAERDERDEVARDEREGEGSGERCTESFLRFSSPRSGQLLFLWNASGSLMAQLFRHFYRFTRGC